MGTIIVGIIVFGCAGLIVRTMIHDKKKGKSLQCGCDCKNCGGLLKEAAYERCNYRRT